MECIGSCMWVFWMCGGDFGCSGGGGGGVCSVCLLIRMSMWWFCILYAFFRVFGKACIGSYLGIGFDMLVRKRVFGYGLRRL